MKFPAIIIAFSLLTHLLFFGQPKAVVFDEVYMGNFVSSYSQERYYFDIHPPLAKLAEHYVGKMMGINYDNTDFGQIGNTFNSDGIVDLRILPVIAGILLPLVIYFICLLIGISPLSSLIVGLLLCFESSLITQSRFILFDSMLVLFGFISILLYLIYVKKNSKYYIVLLSALFASFAFSIKWTGLAYPLLIVVLEIIRVRNIVELFKFIAVYVVVGATVYVSAFALHFSYFTRVGAEGFISRFIDLNKNMLTANTNLTATHQYTSKWYTWPFMIRPIFYWQDVELKKYLYLLGNPLVYWFGTLSITVSMIFAIIKKGKNKIAVFLTLGFLVNFIPFIFIGRVMFLYHYEAALIFSIMAIGFVLDFIKKDWLKLTTASVIVLSCASLFIYFSPLTYGLHLSDGELASKMWFSSWR